MSDETIESRSPARSRWPAMVAAGVFGVVIGGGAISLWPSRTSAVPVASAPAPQGTLPDGVVEIPDVAQRNAGIQVARVQTGLLPATIDVTGAVSPVESQVAHIRPLARGIVEEVSVTLGARVTAGQALLTYDNIELGQLIGEFLSETAARRQAESDLALKQKAVDRGQELIKLEAIAQQQLEMRVAELKNADAALASQRARVSRIEEQIHRFGLSDTDLANLRPGDGTASHRTASHSILRAPFAGVITAMDVARGELGEPDREFFTISDMSTVWVQADVYEKDLTKVRIGSDVTVRVEAYPDRMFAGRLTYISDLIDPKTRTAKVRCVVANSDGALKLDMFARVVVPTTEQRTAVLVPTDAVQTVNGQAVVFIRRSATTFERRRVELGARAGSVVAILSGVTPSDEVVGAGSFYLKTALLRDSIGGEG